MSLQGVKIVRASVEGAFVPEHPCPSGLGESQLGMSVATEVVTGTRGQSWRLADPGERDHAVDLRNGHPSGSERTVANCRRRSSIPATRPARPESAPILLGLALYAAGLQERRLCCLGELPHLPTGGQHAAPTVLKTVPDPYLDQRLCAPHWANESQVVSGTSPHRKEWMQAAPARGFCCSLPRCAP